MDAQAIAVAVMGFLGPYLAVAGESFAKQAGEKLAEKVSSLYQTIKEKFQGDTYAEQSLARTEEKPDSEARRATLTEVLVEKLTEDADFAQRVQKLLEEAKDASGNISIIGDNNIVGDSNTIQSVVAHGGSISNVTQTSHNK